ncbi:MAG: replicative DNA helicase [Lachnospiraceae bacterium]|nr:replicative DNA helicase [Lachnospiraceae bacterium]
MAAVEEALIKRILPNSIEAEQSVIGAMIIDREAITIASEIVSGEDFYNKQYGIVFDAMVELFEESRAVDMVTLQDRLKEKDVPSEISSLDFLRNIVANVITSANVKEYALIVSEKATLRKLIRLNDEISNMCYAGKENLDNILETTEKSVFDLLQRKNTSDFVPIRKVVMNAMKTIEAASRNQGHITGIATGFYELDHKTSGMQPADLVLIAARPSMGKTAFVLNIAQYAAFRQNKHVAIFSLEMTKEQLVNRLFSLEANVDAQHLRVGELTDQEWEKLVIGADTIGKSNLEIDDTPGIGISEMRSKCRKMKLERGLDMIIIDYLQLMSGSGRSESRQQEVSEISRSLKKLARELNVPVLALSQLSRAVEQRPDKRPMMSDLRDSGAIEQDADVCMFIYRDDYYNRDSEKKGISEIIIGKQRNGPVGTVELAWLPELTKFANKARESDKALLEQNM